MLRTTNAQQVLPLGSDIVAPHPRSYQQALIIGDEIVLSQLLIFSWFFAAPALHGANCPAFARLESRTKAQPMWLEACSIWAWR